MAELRASDADRDRTVEALQQHTAAGRLTVEELDERIAAADAATTLGELAGLQRDLPTVVSRRPRQRRRALPILPGWHEFTARWHRPTTAQVAVADLLAHVAPTVSAHRFELTQRFGDRLRFERERRPVWTFVVAVLFPVFGWFALLHKRHVRLTIDIAEDEQGTTLVAMGVAPLSLRRGFVALED